MKRALATTAAALVVGILAGPRSADASTLFDPTFSANLPNNTFTQPQTQENNSRRQSEVLYEAHDLVYLDYFTGETRPANTFDIMNTMFGFGNIFMGSPDQTGQVKTGLSAGGATIRTGLSAGDHGFPMGLWLNYAHTSFDNDHPTIAYDGDTNSIYAGADWRLLDALIAGVSIGYDNTDTHSNLPQPGGTFSNSHDDTDSVTVSPYAIYVINDIFDVDASFGYTNGDTDSRHDVAGATVTSQSDTSTWFWQVNGNANFWFGNLGVVGTVGFRRSVASTDDYVESNGNFIPENESTLATIVGRVKGTYYWETGWGNLPAIIPNLSLAVEHDTARDRPDVGPGQVQPSNDTTGLVFGGGATFIVTDSISAGFDVSTILGREDESSTTVSANMRISLP